MKEIKKNIAKNPKKMMEYGSIIFGVGLLLAFLMPIFKISNVDIKQIILATLILIGIVVGFLNVTNDEAVMFLVSALAFILLTGPFFGVVVKVFSIQSDYLYKVFENIIFLVYPAATVVALKSMLIVAKNED